MKFGYTINNKLMMNSKGKLIGIEVNDPYNPLGLPPNTFRVRTNDGKPPNEIIYAEYDTATLVEGTTDIYDVYKSGTDFKRLFHDSTNLIEVIGANTNGITNIEYMFSYCPSLSSVSLFDTSNVTSFEAAFKGCKSLTSVPAYDTSNVTGMYFTFCDCSSLSSIPWFDTSNVTIIYGMLYNCLNISSVPLYDTSNVVQMGGMLYNCTSITSLPLFDTSKVNWMECAFQNCVNVQSGALDLYRQASTQTKPPRFHEQAFHRCGVDTETGSAELAQIPSDWK